mmetsp:Transcript_28499/g.68595  ORF Transcript_28499/g.68595 Transcript_28499/m.68595 type:complete len:89 (+) Transcript_28499:287-553(+)
MIWPMLGLRGGILHEAFPLPHCNNSVVVCGLSSAISFALFIISPSAGLAECDLGFFRGLIGLSHATQTVTFADSGLTLPSRVHGGSIS